MQKRGIIKVRETQDIEINNDWLLNDRDDHTSRSTSLRNGSINIYDFNLSDLNESCQSLFDTTDELIRDYKKVMLAKLRVVKLKSISVTPTSQISPHVLNLKQEFTFPQSKFAAQNCCDNFTQTINGGTNRIKTPYPYAAIRDLIDDHVYSRPQSFPMDNPSNHSMKYVRPTNFDAKNNNTKSKMTYERIGDGIDNNLQQIKCNVYEFEKQIEDLEVTKELQCQNPVQCVIVKPKNQSTPTFKCKTKCQRPQTKPTRKREMSHDDVDKSTVISVAKNSNAPKKANPSKGSKSDVISNSSTEFCNVGGNYSIRLSAIVDQLQDLEWEVCIDGLKKFSQIASAINWESDLGARFIPIINRKLIDFFKSPRSNLCRIACQVAGDFFLLAKSTKRPEFDEIVDILLCKTADQNKFIQKEANTALDKMASCVSIHHSVRAICAKATVHKNPIVRATTARILTEICKKAGNDQIIGSDANSRTRKHVLSNLAIFLLDKNMETRRNGEQLCKLLKNHKFFMEYFFKDVENNFKIPLRKILNHM